MSQRYRSFADFYPFYLSQHKDQRNRRMHFLASWVVIAFAVASIVTGNRALLIGAPVGGYFCAWIGHFFFEKNKPATFTYPIYSLIGDWVMFYQMLTGRIPV